MKPTFSSAVSLKTHIRWPAMSVPSRRLRLPPPGVDVGVEPLGVVSEPLSSESSRFREGPDLKKRKVDSDSDSNSNSNSNGNSKQQTAYCEVANAMRGMEKFGRYVLRNTDVRKLSYGEYGVATKLNSRYQSRTQTSATTTRQSLLIVLVV